MTDTSAYLQYSFIIPAGLTIAGWFVVARQADRREFRKEVREQLKELRTSTDEIRLRATAYWLADKPKLSGPSAIALSAEVKRLGRYARNLEAAGLTFDTILHMVEVRKLATGGDFQSRARVRTEADEERLDNLSGALEDIMSAADAAFYEEFHPRRSHRWLRWLPIAGTLMLVRD